MTEEIDSIGPIGGATSSMDLTSGHDSPAPAPTARAPSREPRPAVPDDLAAGTPDSAPPADSAPIESLAAAVEQINAHLKRINRILRLRVDAHSGVTSAEIRNSTTGQVLQYIPEAEVVHLAEVLAGWARGESVLVDLIA